MLSSRYLFPVFPFKILQENWLELHVCIFITWNVQNSIQFIISWNPKYEKNKTIKSYKKTFSRSKNMPKVDKLSYRAGYNCWGQRHRCAQCPAPWQTWWALLPTPHQIRLACGSWTPWWAWAPAMFLKAGSHCVNTQIRFITYLWLRKDFTNLTLWHSHWMMSWSLPQNGPFTSLSPSV